MVDKLLQHGARVDLQEEVSRNVAYLVTAYCPPPPHYIIRVSVDSLCRDGADMPRAPYIGKACTRLNGESLSLFRGLTMVLK